MQKYNILLKYQQLPVVHDDHYLKLHFDHLQYRSKKFIQSSLLNFAHSYKTYGIHALKQSIVYKQWAPNAQELYLFGEFNSWNRFQFKAKKDQFGVWTLQIPHVNGSPLIKHNTKIKIIVKTGNGDTFQRIPAWIHYAIQDNQNKMFDGVFWNPQKKFQFKYPRPQLQSGFKIYQCHIGMSGIEPKIHSYNHFKEIVLPMIKKLEYNTIQIMAIMQHPYYGSFGYHVSNFFAVSSRFGTPDEFKSLVDQAHHLGIKVLIDLIHSHAASNSNQGLNFLDGTDYQYFHSLPKGRHQLWDSRIFNYQKYEVIRFLLSNVAFYMQEYNLDGFRFDGITSMLYHHRGISFGFTGNYNQYFNQTVDIDAVILLMLQNQIIHEIYPNAITIAEDVSGMPTLCRTVLEGGIGFDYRLAMAIPDKWIKLLKEVPDENWNMDQLVGTLTNRRWKEKCVCYAQSHDQALVGDKTISMWLLDKQIYFNMKVDCPQTIVTFRAMALHKMIRLITLGLGGEAYLNFMGNQFGHPEWIDFPRQGNNWSYHYCRRRWDLIDSNELKFKFLYNWDKDMIALEIKYNLLNSKHQWVNHKNNQTKVIAFEKGSLLFVFNFHPTESYQNYKIGTDFKGIHKIQLQSDNYKYGGHSRLLDSYKIDYYTQQEYWDGRRYSITCYLPSRCVIVFRNEEIKK